MENDYQLSVNYEKSKTYKLLTKSEINNLFPLVNSGRDYYVDIKSHDLVDKIIELWFESNGYDFWDNPFPDVVEWHITNDDEIYFAYI